MQELYYVRASSLPNRYYTVALGPRGWSCECKGFHYRGDCYHISACVAGLVRPARPSRTATLERARQDAASLYA